MPKHIVTTDPTATLSDAFKGDWDAATDYVKGELVVRHGGVYVANDENTNSDPNPGTSEVDAATGPTTSLSGFGPLRGMVQTFVPTEALTINAARIYTQGGTPALPLVVGIANADFEGHAYGDEGYLVSGVVQPGDFVSGSAVVSFGDTIELESGTTYYFGISASAEFNYVAVSNPPGATVNMTIASGMRFNAADTDWDEEAGSGGILVFDLLGTPSNPDWTLVFSNDSAPIYQDFFVPYTLGVGNDIYPPGPRVGRSGQLTEIHAAVATPPTGAALVVQVRARSTGSLLGTVTIPDGETTGTQSVTSAVSQDDRLRFDVTQVGSTTSGSGLAIQTVIQ